MQGVGALQARPYLLAGPSLAVKLSANAAVELDGEELYAEDDFTDEVSGSDLGLTIGGGVDIGRALVEVRYTFGLKNIARDSDDETGKNRTFAVLVGFRFGQ